MDIHTLSCLIDLHLHLDGSISVNSIRKLAALEGVTFAESDESLRRRIQVDADCRNLNEFLTKFAFPCSFLQTRNTLISAVHTLLEELNADGVMYAEIRFAPQLHTYQGLTQRDVVEAVIEGVKTSGADTSCNLILCCMRGIDTRAANRTTIELAGEFLGKGVCAVDLAGAEALFPNADYAEEFALARSLGIPSTIHAGEAADPKSVWDALALGAVRIGHGVRSYEDPQLLKRLADSQIPLELCPVSNLCTSVFKEMSEYPLRALLDAGVRATLNTDDRSICGIDLKTELETVAATFSLTDRELQTLLLNAADAAFVSDAQKRAFREIILQQTN